LKISFLKNLLQINFIPCDLFWLNSLKVSASICLNYSKLFGIYVIKFAENHKRMRIIKPKEILTRRLPSFDSLTTFKDKTESRTCLFWHKFINDWLRGISRNWESSMLHLLHHFTSPAQKNLFASYNDTFEASSVV
jgi:hypothetical protein